MEQKITIPEGYELKKVNDSEYRIVKKEIELPNSWKEFCETYPLNGKEAWIANTSKIECAGNIKTIRDEYLDRNTLPNREYAKAILAICQLIQLRDCYRQGWVPDWKDESLKYTIEYFYGKMQISQATHISQPLAFQSAEIRDKFYNNFKDLIEKTKPLFM